MWDEGVKPIPQPFFPDVQKTFVLWRKHQITFVPAVLCLRGAFFFIPFCQPFAYSLFHFGRMKTTMNVDEEERYRRDSIRFCALCCCCCCCCSCCSCCSCSCSCSFSCSCSCSCCFSCSCSCCCSCSCSCSFCSCFS